LALLSGHERVDSRRKGQTDKGYKEGEERGECEKEGKEGRVKEK